MMVTRAITKALIADARRDHVEAQRVSSCLHLLLIRKGGRDLFCCWFVVNHCWIETELGWMRGVECCFAARYCPEGDQTVWAVDLPCGSVSMCQDGSTDALRWVERSKVMNDATRDTTATWCSTKDGWRGATLRVLQSENLKDKSIIFYIIGCTKMQQTTLRNRASSETKFVFVYFKFIIYFT